MTRRKGREKEVAKRFKVSPGMGQIARQLLEKPVAILRTILAALLEFDDAGADEPVAEHEALSTAAAARPTADVWA